MLDYALGDCLPALYDFPAVMRKRLARHVIACLISLTFAGTLQAQVTAALGGTVADPAGALVPDAELVLVNDDTGARRETRSDAQGRYTFAQLPPGRYRLTARRAGFADLTIGGIRLLVNTPATLAVAFEKLGAVAETVAVSASAVQVNTVDASIGNAIGDKPITQLPFEARNVVGLLSLQPGVVYLGEPNPGAAGDYRSGAVNGGKSDQANVTLDGVDVNEQLNRAAFTSVLRVTLDSVQEFRTITTNAGADFGRTSGAQVTLVTKSGSNRVHGSVYEYLRNTATSANDFFSNEAGVEKAQLNRNVYGASAGGPVKPNRLFFFLNYEGRKDRSEGVASARSVPTADFRNGVFTYTRNDGSTGKLTPSQIRALDPLGVGAAPAVLALFQTYPLPNSAAAGDSLNTSGYIFNAPTPLDWNTYIAKFDYRPDANGNHQVFWRGNLQDDRFVNGLPRFPGEPPSSVLLDHSKGFAFGYTAVLRPNLVGLFRYGLTRQGTETTGLQQRPAARFRDISDRYAGTRGSIRKIPVHQWSGDISWVKGAHTWGFGGVVRLIRNDRSNTNNSFSDALANSSALLGSGNEFLAGDAANTTVYKRQFTNLLGILTQLTGQYNYDLQGNLLPEGSAIRRKFAAEEYELYAQDAWRASRALTLSAGIRVSLLPPVYETQGYQTTSVPSLEDWYNLRGALAAQGKPQSEAPAIQYDLAGKTGRALYPFHRDFAPRLAAAWSPQGERGLSRFLFGGPGASAIRAGFGMYYDLFGQALVRDYDSTALGFSTQLTNPLDASSKTYPRFTGYYNVPFSSPYFPKGGATSTFPQTYPAVFAITNGLDDQLKAPYAVNLDFSVQRQFAHGFLVQGSYIGRLSRRSLVKDDLAMATNLADPQSGTTYRQAAGKLTALINRGVPVSQVRKIPYFENLWPDAAGGGLTATQNIYNLYAAQGGDYTTALLALDGGGCAFVCSIYGPYALLNAQYSSLVALRSRGRGSYHAMQWTVRKAFESGVEFDFNCTWSKSIDLGSLPEYGGGTQINSTSIINSWFPNDMKAVSDYDTRHLLSAMWLAELPFGNGKRSGFAGAILNHIVSGWSVSGIFRLSSGLPTSVSAGGVWPTNWQVGSFAIQTGAIPAYQTVKNGPRPAPSGEPGPNLFTDPAAMLKAYDLPLAGDSGQRNGIRGDGYFGMDVAVGRRFRLFGIKDQPHSVQIRAESFNVMNAVRFDPNSASVNILNPARFGQYTALLTRPRVLQFAARYEF